MVQFVRSRLNNINNTTVFLILIAFAAGSLWGSHVLDGAEFQWGNEFFPDLGLAVQSTWNALTTNSDWSSGFWQNFSTEMMGAIITFGLIELVVGTRQRRADDTRAERELKESLLARAKSRNNAVAAGAIDEMRAKGWHEGEDGLLVGANLQQANLEKVDLKDANLSEADLLGANLSGASFFEANLSGAELGAANLSGARMWGANLSGANLGFANLSGAILSGATLSGVVLSGATLSGADLGYANLSGADLWGANLDDVKWRDPFLGAATLPDGTTWTAETELARFTDKEHPQHMTTFEQVNVRRLDQGQGLIDMRDENGDRVYPLPDGERLNEETMRERVNARRRELGLEPY